MERFYCPEAAGQADVALDAEESHHAVRVLRKRIGDVIEVFDGEGRAARGVIREMTKREVSVSIETWRLDPPRKRHLTLISAAPKSERLRWLVEKGTELGVAEFVPIQTERSVVDPGLKKLDRLRGVVISACKQCGRNDLMQIREPLAWQDACLATSGFDRRYLAHPGGPPASVQRFPLGRIAFAVGPEGGWTEAEMADAISQGWQQIGLGMHVLRIETANLVAASLILTSEVGDGA